VSLWIVPAGLAFAFCAALVVLRYARTLADRLLLGGVGLFLSLGGLHHWAGDDWTTFERASFGLCFGLGILLAALSPRTGAPAVEEAPEPKAAGGRAPRRKFVKQQEETRRELQASL
jgi:hypothetical protein